MTQRHESTPAPVSLTGPTFKVYEGYELLIGDTVRIHVVSMRDRKAIVRVLAPAAVPILLQKPLEYIGDVQPPTSEDSPEFGG
jgi:sRNA-binding carbon storage regulator CsrA